MNLQELLVMRASRGLLAINPQNAEMLAISKNDINDAIHTFQSDIENESCTQFLSPLEEENLIEASVESCEGIGVLPSFACNYCCKYCFEKNFKKEEMTQGMITGIKPFLKAWDKQMGVKTKLDEVGLMGGELFRSDSHELVEDIFREFGDVKYQITTNAAELMEYVELIRRHRTSVTVSLDGTESMHLSRRIPKILNAYQRTIDSIRFLVSEGIETTIAVVYNPSFSRAEYSNFFDELEELGWLKKENLKVNMAYESDLGIEGCSRDKQLWTIRQFKQLLHEDTRARYVGKTIIAGANNVEQILETKFKTGKVELVRCSANISAGLVFAPDGFVYNCNFIKREENRVGQFYPNVEIYKDTVEKFRTRNIFTIAACKECKMALFCQGGCPASALTQNGNVESEFCGIWKDDEILKDINLVVNVERLYEMARRYERT